MSWNVFSYERHPPKDTDTYLTIVKCSFHSDVVDIGIRYRRHLCLLDRRNTTLWMKNKDRNVCLVSKAVNSSA